MAILNGNAVSRNMSTTNVTTSYNTTTTTTFSTCATYSSFRYQTFGKNQNQSKFKDTGEASSLVDTEADFADLSGDQAIFYD